MTHTSPRSPFLAWLDTQRERDGPIGDLARDVAQDEDFPRTMIYPTMRDYLWEKGAVAETCQALREAWRQYHVHASQRHARKSHRNAPYRPDRPWT